MSDRIKGITVTFAHDIKDEDFDEIVKAFKMFKCVAHVEPSLTTHDDHMNREKVKHELRDKFWDFYRENFSL